MWGLEDDMFDEFERARRQLEQAPARGRPTALRTTGAGSFPPVNVGASAEQVDIYFFMAGVEPQRLELTVQQNLLVLAGERLSAVPEQAQLHRHERGVGPFQRMVTLPEDVDPEQVSAVYRNGLLHVTLKRRATVRPRQIPVQ